MRDWITMPEGPPPTAADAAADGQLLIDSSGSAAPVPVLPVPGLSPLAAKAGAPGGPGA